MGLDRVDNSRTFGTYQRGNVDTVLLVATAHGEVLIELVQRVLGVALWDSLVLLVNCSQYWMTCAYVEELDVVKKVVVEGEVVAGNDIDAGVLLDLPVLQPQTLALLEQVIAGELVRPVGLIGLLELTVRTHAGETEYGRVYHCDVIVRCGQL